MTPMTASATPSLITGVADVLVDGAPAYMGALSYLVPDDFEVVPGTAVEVPFGTRRAHGLVLGPGNPAKATRALTRVWGTRLHPADVAVMHTLAGRYLCTVSALARRAAPTDGKGATPLNAGAVQLAIAPVAIASAPDRYLLRPPLTDPAHLAATAAAALAQEGQVLVLCPTRHLAKAVARCFSSGAAVLDDPGAWAGFVAGTVGVGVGTRAAALWSPASLAALVVAEEDHPGHVEARQPRTNARDVAVARARSRGVPVCLTGASPSGAGLGAGVKVVRGGESSDLPPLRVVPASGRTIPAAAQVAVAKMLAAGGTVAVACPVTAARARCSQCRTLCPGADALVGDTDAPVSAPTACGRCGDPRVQVVGWDPPRVMRRLGAVDAIAPGKTARQPADLVVVLAADAARPGLEPEATLLRRIMHAAAWCKADGRILAVANDPATPTLVALAAGDQRGAARGVWERARADKLPPYGRVVEVNVACARPPAVGSWPGKVFGPRATAAGEWQMLVRCADDELSALAKALDRLRQRAKVRITVT